MKEKFVYFIQAEGNGPIKIGCSQNPKIRLGQFKTWSPYPLRMIACAPGDFYDEMIIHGEFSAACIHGEWFHPTEVLLKYIDGVVKSGIIPRDMRPGPNPTLSTLRYDVDWSKYGTDLGGISKTIGVVLSTVRDWQRYRVPPLRIPQLMAIAGANGDAVVWSDLFKFGNCAIPKEYRWQVEIAEHFKTKPANIREGYTV